MVLNGIGGKTIAEAKENLLYDEFLLWRAYIIKYGSLNIGRRIEQSSALLCHLYVSSKSKRKFTIYDFMPHEEEIKVEAEQNLTLEQAMKLWD